MTPPPPETLPLPDLLTPNCNTTHKWNSMPDERQRRYNSIDTYTTALLQPALEEELRRNGQLEFFTSWWEIVYPAMRMQRRGFGEIDWKEVDRVEGEINQELGELETKVLDHCPLFPQLLEEAETWLQENREAHPTWGARLTKGYESRRKKALKRRESFFNFTNDMRWFLFDHLAIKPAPKSKREGREERSLNDSAIRWMLEHLLKRDEPNRWLLQDLAHIVRLRTILKMFLNPLRSGPSWLHNNRPCPTFKLYGAETLRWSVARPPLHSWPPRMRSIIRAREGHLFVGADYSQIEAGIAALEAQDQTELREWQDPDGDLHRLMAMDALGLSRPEWDAIPEKRRTALRQVFKSVRYERLYGGQGTKALGKQPCPCPREECSPEAAVELQGERLSGKPLLAALARWSRAHPGFDTWLRRHLAGVRKNGNRWVSPFGYPMISAQPMKEAERQWINKPKQHGVAMIINRAIAQLDQLGAPLVFQHHDQIFIEVPEKEANWWKDTMVAVMTQPIPEYGEVRFPVDWKIGKTWKEAK